MSHDHKMFVLPVVVLSVVVFVWLTPAIALAQQIVDPAFKPIVNKPEFVKGTGPLVLIDAGHKNFHTREGRYQPFALLIRSDGYRVDTHKGNFTQDSLAAADILVIANAIGGQAEQSPRRVTQSAFDKQEIAAVHAWVQGGGRLLLIADHMPFGAAAAKLAERFGIEMTNGFAFGADRPSPLIFHRSRGLVPHPITDGRSSDERIERVATFTGQAFRAPHNNAKPLLVFDDQAFLLIPKNKRQFTADTPRKPIGGWLQAAAIREGTGRLAVFGEAGMFTAQLSGPTQRAMGMNSPLAPHNAQFVLNVLHWLSAADKKR